MKFWVAKKDDEIVGFLFADKREHIHMPFSVYQQIYCCTWAKGTVAARTVKLLHEKLLEEAERQRCPMAWSTGSHLDEDYTFVRMLEKFGWERRGYLAARKTSHWDRLPSEVQRSGLG